MFSMVAKDVPLRPTFRVGNSQTSLGARSGEYGGWVMTGMLFSARNCCTTSDVWLGAHHKATWKYFFHCFLTNALHGRREIYVPSDVLPWKQLPVPIMWDVGWIPEPVRKKWRRDEIPGIEQLLVLKPCLWSNNSNDSAVYSFFCSGFPTAIFNWKTFFFVLLNTNNY